MKHITPLFCGLFVMLCCAFPPFVSANEAQFISDVSTSVRFTPDGLASVTKTVHLQGTQPNTFPDRYTIALTDEQISSFVATSGELVLPHEQTDTGWVVTFPEELGLQNEIIFLVRYVTTSLVEKKGQIYSVVLPLLQESPELEILSYGVEMVVPKAWGAVQHTSKDPETRFETAIEEVLTFNVMNDMNVLPELTMSLGPFQLYDVRLLYQLENDTEWDLEQSIAFPPVTSSQEVFVESIAPFPDRMSTDVDGNILGFYTISADKKLEVVFTGQVLVKTPEKQDSATRPSNWMDYTIMDRYWEIGDENIAIVSAQLDEPEEIYSYVTRNLTYDYERVARGDLERMGAVWALNNPDNAACMEFTDLTITLLRSVGIPAREVNGYAYLEPDEIASKPVASDVLHSWVQYWKDGTGWVDIDPTWGASTGFDYFNSFDHDHLTFTIKGITSEKPFPAGSYRNDNYEDQQIFVELSESKDPLYPSFEEWQLQWERSSLPWWQRIFSWIFG